MLLTVSQKQWALGIALVCLFGSVFSHAKESASDQPPISRYDLDQFTESSATVLRKDISIDIEPTGKANTTIYVAVLLNDDVAIQDYSQMSLNHNTYYEDLEIEFARVYNGDAVSYLSDDAVSRQNASTENFFYDDEYTQFALPALRKGSVIELQYTKQGKRPLLPEHFSSKLGAYWWEGKAGGAGYRLDPVANSAISISFPADMSLDFRQSKLIPVEAVRSQDDMGQTISWTMENLPAITPENSVPEDLNLYPVIAISSLKDWGQLNRWAYDLFTSNVDNGKKISEIAETIKSDFPNERDQIEAVFDFLEENVRYVFAHVGRNGYEPHPALEALQNGYGDCKDQTVLAVSLLSALGIESYAALTAANGSQLLNGLPMNYFDHMLVHIPATETRAAIWFDTTGDTLDFPGIHWSYEGQSALVLNGQDTQLSTIHSNQSSDHLLKIALVFNSETGVDINIQVDAIYSGLMGQNIGNMLRYAPDSEAIVKETLEPLYPRAKIVNVTHEKLESAKDTYRMTANFVAKDSWKGSPEPLNFSMGINQFINLAANLNALDEPNKRQQPFQTNLPFKVIFNARIEHPGEGYAPILINTSPDYSSDYFNVTQSSQVTQQGTFLVDAEFTMREQVIPVDDYGLFYRAAQNIIELPLWVVSYQVDERALELSKLEASREQSENGPSDIESIVGNAEIYLNNGKFDDALELADRAITLDAGNAKAYYLRGVALGYKQQFELSNSAFAKALELGYEL